MNKEKIQQLLSHPLFVFILTCLCLLGIFSLRQSSQKALISKESIQKLENNIKTLEQEQVATETKLENSQQTLNLEKIMRNELLQKKEGEVILQIPEQDKTETTASTEQLNEKNGPLEEWKKLLSF